METLLFFALAIVRDLRTTLRTINPRDGFTATRIRK
jgi:hypothetical protein